MLHDVTFSAVCGNVI